MKRPVLSLLTVAVISLAAAPVAANGARDKIIAGFAAAAGQPLNAQRGADLFLGQHTGGKPATPSCTTCHTNNPANAGRTRAGKAIAPMAVSRTPDRFTDPAKVAKWIKRNCTTVLGRQCTAVEKGDILTWLSSL